MELALKVKKAIKKVVALSMSAAMFGATITGALAVADLSTLPSPFVTDGVLDAFIVVGSPAAPSSDYAKDVAGAIDVAAALAQKATSSTAAGAGSATLSVRTFKGVQSSAGSLAETTLTAGKVGSIQGANQESRDSLKNTTYVDTDSQNWTSEQAFLITNVSQLKDGSLYIPAKKAIYSVGLLDNAGNVVNLQTNSVTATLGKYIYVLGTKYYLSKYNATATATSDRQVKLGSTTEYKKTEVNTAVTEGDYTITPTGVSTTSAAITITGPSGSKSATVGKGNSTTYGDITVVIDDAFAATAGTSYVDLTIVTAGVTLNWGAEATDLDSTGWLGYWDANKFNLTNKNVITLASAGTEVNGPASYFTLEFTSRGSLLSTTNASISVWEQEQGNLVISWHNDTGCFGSGQLPGARFYNATNTGYLQGTWGQITVTNITDYGQKQLGFIRIKEPDGSNLYINCTTTDPIYAVDAITNAEYLVKYVNSTDTLGVTRDGLKNAVGSGAIINATDIQNKATALAQHWWNVTIQSTGANVTVYGGATGESTGTWFIRNKKSELYDTAGTPLRQNVGYGTVLTWDGTHLEVKEPDDNIIKFSFIENSTNRYFYVNSMTSRPSNDSLTSWGSHYREDEALYAANVTVDHSWFNLTVPSMNATIRMGSYLYSDPTEVNVGDTATISGAVIKVESTTGVGLNAMDPTQLSRTVDEVTTTEKTAKPMILIGGPLANALVADLGLTEADFKVTVDNVTSWWGGHALIKLYESAFNGTHAALVIAGVGATDTRLASRVVAKELATDLTSPLTAATGWNGTELWLATEGATVATVTIATKPA